MADKSEGLTQAGIVGLNQSIEAFVYCIFGAQVDVRSLILGSSPTRVPCISRGCNQEARHFEERSKFLARDWRGKSPA